jgi:L-ascorbate 6-phosphate lactonase
MVAFNLAERHNHSRGELMDVEATGARPLRVLVTGANGFLGHLVCNHLEQFPDDFEVHALDRSAMPSMRVPARYTHRTPPERFLHVDLTKRGHVGRVVRGMDVIVHLAANPSLDAGPWSILQDLFAQYALLDAANRASVRGLVYASSLATMAGHGPRATSIKERTWPWPTTPYGFGKVLGEWIARRFFRAHGLSSICLRLGAINEEDAPPADPFWSSAWCAHEDFLRLVERSVAIVARKTRIHAVCLGASDNPGLFVDMRHTKRCLGIERSRPISRSAPSRPIPVRWLGQSGVRFDFDGHVVYTDPYLSDSLFVGGDREHERSIPVPIPPEAVTDADWILISHGHSDHCDTSTLLPMLRSSPQARVVCPAAIGKRLGQAGVDAERLRDAAEHWSELGRGLRVRAVPAAHPTIDRDWRGRPACVGYVLEHEGRRVYFAGDTSLTDELLDCLRTMAPFDAVLLPVNERNYFREGRGIIGNLTVREAFGLAERLHAEQLVPIHWDMFSSNGAFREEIELMHRLLSPPFRLSVRPEAL